MKNMVPCLGLRENQQELGYNDRLDVQITNV